MDKSRYNSASALCWTLLVNYFSISLFLLYTIFQTWRCGIFSGRRCIWAPVRRR